MDFYSLVYSIVIYPILFILPAYVANGSPVIFHGKKPLDFNKTLNGKRIFGDNKTVKGLVFGILSGIIIGAVESLFISYMLVISIALAIGTHCGDLTGSFIKRRLDIKPGSSVPLMDQYLFLVFALAFAVPFGHFPSLYGLLFIVILTGILHLATNKAAYMLKLKKVPW